MTATVTPFHSSWLDGDDVVLQSGTGATARVHVDDLLALWREARSSDDETAAFRGRTWHRDHLTGAVDLAVRAGLIDTCRAVDGRAACETPLRYDQRVCDAHERH